MHILITGGAGFLGQRLTRTLLERSMLRDPDGRERSIEEITLLDVVPPPATGDARVRSLTGDIADLDVLGRVIDADVDSIFHLAAIVSGMAEANFDLGMRINVDATRTMLDLCQGAGHCPRVVFTSSVAVYGGPLPNPVPESTALTPHSSYGTQKAIRELLINDYTRKGFIDGRVLRLPTITVRPGRPNAAASSFASGIIREPLNGEMAVCPVNVDARLWLSSPSTAIDCLVAAHDLPAAALGLNRTINVPGISVTVGEMVAALERVVGSDVVKRIRWEPDAAIQGLVATWPGALETYRAQSLGFPSDDNFETIIRRYIDERESEI